jgi:hypothetical protein
MPFETLLPRSASGGGGGVERLAPAAIEKQARSWARKAMQAVRDGTGVLEQPDYSHKVITFTAKKGEQVSVKWWVSGRSRNARKCLTEVVVRYEDGTVNVMRWRGKWYVVEGGMPEEPPLGPGETKQDKFRGDAW